MLNKLYVILCFWLTVLSGVCYGQTANKSYFYEKKGDKQFVLSEKKRSANSFEKLNSLFIWRKDTVYRIVFEYENKKSVSFNKNRRIYNLFPLIDFINNAGHINLYNKKLTELKAFYNSYDSYRLSGTPSELVKFTKTDIDDGQAYTTKLKVLINSWNAKHNPMADRLASVAIHDGDGEIMLKNVKRRIVYHNDFPLSFCLPGIDSLYFTKVHLIDIYEAYSNVGANGQDKYLKGYRLISSVNFDNDEFDLKTNQGRTINLKDKTLAYIFKSTLPVDTTRLFNQLSLFGLSKFNREYEDGILEKDKPLQVKAWNQSSHNKSDTSIAENQPRVQNENLHSDHGLAEYCKACYDTSQSVAYRISRHCPVNVKTLDNFQSQNWRYNFTRQGLNFFSVENPIRLINEPAWASDQEFEHLQAIWNWQLMSPGVGYWLTSSEIFGVKYDFSPIDYYINGKKVN